jgi:hypothetical protein
MFEKTIENHISVATRPSVSKQRQNCWIGFDKTRYGKSALISEEPI